MTKRRLNQQKNQLARRHGAAAQIAQPEDFEPSHFIVISSAQREILLVLPKRSFLDGWRQGDRFLPPVEMTGWGDRAGFASTERDPQSKRQLGLRR
jgi:hypothetical protein